MQTTRRITEWNAKNVKAVIKRVLDIPTRWLAL
jgi:hypothetical protein